MQKLIDRISAEVSAAFEKMGLPEEFGKVSVSNRPDLGDYQCNGAMPAAKIAHKAPIQIANDIKENLKGSSLFSEISAVNPGFLNFRISGAFLADYLCEIGKDERFGLAADPSPRKIVIDYGGPNVAKPLHIGHLRSAIIGESIKRIYRYFGNEVIGDVHLGDWGLQMGLIIAEVKERQPNLPYFDASYQGPYPEEAPFTLSDLEEIYPFASAKSKENPEFAEKAHIATFELQHRNPGYYALWQHIIRLSVNDLKKNYQKLGVDFDVWYGESDADAYIPPMLQKLKEDHILEESEGALVIDVSEADDKKEVPPCIVVKSDGATLYATTDLATLVQREELWSPDKILYIVDKRQSLHFEQVFRASRKAGIVPPKTELQHIGFGTMNGKDGKPFKTRAGGVMRLEELIREITEFVTEKVIENKIVSADAVEETAAKIAMAALKYGDLSNLATKDYIFDMDRFASFEGNTGPYILYSIVRIKSILSKCKVDNIRILAPRNDVEKELMLQMIRFADNMEIAYRDSAPNIICAYIYDLCTALNRFYHETRILTEEDERAKQSYLSMISVAKGILETCISLLGFEAPEKM